MEPQYAELAGRIEALGRFVLALTETLERQDIIDGPRFCQGLRKHAQALSFEGDHLETARQMLYQAADTLDMARSSRPRLDGR